MKRVLLLPAGAIALLAALHACTPSASPTPGETEQAAPRVVLLSIDGGADWIVSRLIDEGRAPALAAMARYGARADGVVGAMPSLTAVAHATLWTGTWSRRHGVAGTSVARLPRHAHTVLESESGFDGRVLEAEPIWMTAARAGRRVLVLQAAGSYPFSGEHPGHLLQFDVYATRHVGQAIIDGRLIDGRDRFRIGDTWLDVAAGATGLRIGIGDRSWPMQPGPAGRFTPPVPVQAAGHEVRVRLRLLSFDEAAGTYRIFHGAGHEIHASDPALLEEFERAAGALVGEPIAGRYRRGEFGPTIPEGGDGEAERWLFDILQANQEYFAGALEFAAARPWDLLVAYVPNFDAAMHAVAGMVDPSSGRHSPEIEERIWPLVQDLFDRFADDYVTELRRRFPDATLVVTSDHGIEGADGYVLPNVALRKAGLLSVDAEGRIDLPRTKAVFQQARGMMVFINTTDWRDGAVRPDESGEVKRAVTRALLSMHDPRTLRPAIRAVYDAEIDGAGLGIGGARGADLHFDPAPGLYTADSHMGDAEVIDAGPAGQGFHGAAPWRRKMQSIFYAAGPGVAPGRRLGLVYGIDVAPTVAALLGVPPPADAVGRPLDLR